MGNLIESMLLKFKEHSKLVGAQGSPSSGSLLNLLNLCVLVFSFIMVVIHQGGYHDLFVCP